MSFMAALKDLRFALAWTLPLAIGVAAWRSPWAALVLLTAVHVALALVELAAPQWRSPAAERSTRAWFAWCLRAHVLWQVALLVLGVGLSQTAAWPAVVALGVAVGGISGSQGITFAHELGTHDRASIGPAPGC